MSRRVTVLVAAVCLIAAGALAWALLARDRGGGRAATANTHATPVGQGASHGGPFALRLDQTRYPLLPSFRSPPRAGVLFDLDSGRILWQRNLYRRLPIASLTKIMTALLIVQRHRPGERVHITREAVKTTGSKIGLLPKGKRVRLETLLNGLLLVSGNDAAAALAIHDAGTIPAFVRKMNGEARELELACTHFSSPSGIIDRGNRSCPADLAALARADLAQPRIVAVTRKRNAKLPFPIKGGTLYLNNNNPLVVAQYPGINGMKTGETEAAGKCYVATARRGHRGLGLILLGSPNIKRQGQRLLTLGFAYQRRG